MSTMRITVLGLWHLGCVTAGGLAKHFQVTGLDFDEAVVSGLEQGRAALYEPGLNELLAAGLQKNSLRFTTEAKMACADADELWVLYDTPVNHDDESDSPLVLGRCRPATPHLAPDALVLISSQLPAGTCAALEREFPRFHFACSP